MNVDHSDKKSAEDAFDRVCERFEAAWRSADPPAIGEYLSTLARQYCALGESDQVACLLELVRIDLEWRWKRAARTLGASALPREESAHDSFRSHDGVGGLPSRPLIEDYRQQFDILGDHLAILIADEYQVRHRYGDPPDWSEYARRFASDTASLREGLRRVRECIESTSVEIDIDAPHRGHTFKSVLNLPLEIGRQRPFEPGPFAVVSTTTIPRLIVAPTNAPSISRRHVLLGNRRGRQLRLENVSEKLTVGVAGGLAITAGAHIDLELPTRIQIGGISIRLA